MTQLNDIAKILCSRCNERKPTSEFYDSWWKFNKPMCKECYKAHKLQFKEQLRRKA